MSERPAPYAILGVSPDATPATIRKAYRDRARSAHPDLIGDAGLATMRNLNLAWDTLRDPVRRAAHDTSRLLAGRAGLSQPRQPEWTGAAGRPPGRPSGSRLDFGLMALPSSPAMISATSARGPWAAPRNLTTYRPSSSASTSPGSEPPSRNGVTYRVARTVRIG